MGVFVTYMIPISSTHDLFPRSLVMIPQPPTSLYCWGDINVVTRTCVAVVGTRTPTEYGIRVTQEFVREWVTHGIVVVSGLAFGIDAYAHDACIRGGGKTIAVLPSGAECISHARPKAHQELASRIIASGGLLLSENPPGYEITKESFLKRNRLISGLSCVTVVIEAGYRSGALSTAYHALEQGKDVMAVPGSVFSNMSRGTHTLLQQGAHPLTCPQDLYEIIKT